MSYQQLTFIIEADLAEPCAEWLESHGALSVTFSEAENEPLFQIEVNEAPLWKKTKVSAFYSADFTIAPLLETLPTHFPKAENIGVDIIKEQDWVRLTQENFPTQDYADNLWIIPSWEKPETHCKNVVRIDPGLAFGTGTHATTAMCLHYLATHPPKNKIVIDYGCGSGILALAALALGAKQVYAIDHDPQALEATANNAQLNAFSNEKNLIILHADQMPPVQASLILANILAKPLIELSEKITRLGEANGTLVLSGLLDEEKQLIIKTYEKQGCQLESQIKKEEWGLLTFLCPPKS